MKRQPSPQPRPLDDIDRQIITALKKDGRMPFAQIAEQMDVSPGTVRQRYYQLVEDGVLQVVPVTNPTLLGYSVMALIGVRVDGSRLREIGQRIAAFEEVIYLVLTTGTYDILAEIICRDNAHLLEFLTQRLRAVEGVRNTETFTYLEIIKEAYF
jgi:Lrp/AsnC family transcriptional regulator for asnA, asnC and gidA